MFNWFFLILYWRFSEKKGKKLVSFLDFILTFLRKRGNNWGSFLLRGMRRPALSSSGSCGRLPAAPLYPPLIIDLTNGSADQGVLIKMRCLMTSGQKISFADIFYFSRVATELLLSCLLASHETIDRNIYQRSFKIKNIIFKYLCRKQRKKPTFFRTFITL